jgi:membrane protein implicated in regulation of membrane protease activity
MDARAKLPAAGKAWIGGCAILMTGAGLYLLYSDTLVWWRVLLGALLVTCPVLAMWLGWRYARPERASKGAAQGQGDTLPRES